MPAHQVHSAFTHFRRVLRAFLLGYDGLHLFKDGIRSKPGMVQGEHVTAQCTAHHQGHAQALDREVQRCLTGKEQKTMEELQAAAQYQLAIRLCRFPGFTAWEALSNSLWL